MQLSFTANELFVILREAYQAGRDSIEKGFSSGTSLDNAYRDARLVDIVDRRTGNFLSERRDNK